MTRSIHQFQAISLWQENECVFYIIFIYSKQICFDGDIFEKKAVLYFLEFKKDAELIAEILFNLWRHFSLSLDRNYILRAASAL